MFPDLLARQVAQSAFECADSAPPEAVSFDLAEMAVVSSVLATSKSYLFGDAA